MRRIFVNSFKKVYFIINFAAANQIENLLKYEEIEYACKMA